MNMPKMNFKKKKNVADQKVVVEPPKNKGKAARNLKANDGSYLDKLHAKIENTAKKREPKEVSKSEKITNRDTKKTNETKPTSKKVKAIDLKVDSFKSIIKPPQMIMELIQDEYDDIVSNENVVLSTRSLQNSKQFSNSMADSNVQQLNDPKIGVENAVVTPETLANKERTQSLKISGNIAYRYSELNEDVNNENQNKITQSEHFELSPESPKSEKKVRESNPSKFIRFSEFRESNNDVQSKTLFDKERITFQGPPEYHDKNFEVVTDIEKGNLDSNKDEPINEGTNFADIFTPKKDKDPISAIQRTSMDRQEDFVPDIFIKKIESNENMLESLQQKAFLEKKGMQVMDTEALFADNNRLSSETLDSNVFELNKNNGLRFDQYKSSGKFNQGIEIDYQTSNFNNESNSHSEKELLENIHNLIEQNHQSEKETEEYRHKKPLQALNDDAQEASQKEAEYKDTETKGDANVSHESEEKQERMKRVITFANVHKLAVPTQEDQDFIKNYYANKDYPKATKEDEEQVDDAIKDNASRDSIDVIERSEAEQNDHVFSIKSDRFNDKHLQEHEIKFQSVANKEMSNKINKPSSKRMDINAHVNPLKMQTNNTINFEQWEHNYVSKDTQEIDNNILNEMNAIYRNTSKFNNEGYDSYDSKNEQLQDNINQNIFLGTSNDSSFDNDEGYPINPEVEPTPEYFTLGDMRKLNKQEDKDRVIDHDQDNIPQNSNSRAKSIKNNDDPRKQHESPDIHEPKFKKLSPEEFEDKFNELIIRMLNKKAALIQDFWRSYKQSKPKDLILADLFKEFIRIKRRNENFVRKNHDMKGIQTSNYSIKIIQREFMEYLDEIVYTAPNSGELFHLIEDLSLLLQKLGIAGN